MMPLPNQINLFNNFAANSWKSLNFPALGGITIEQALVNTFNGALVDFAGEYDYGDVGFQGNLNGIAGRIDSPRELIRSLDTDVIGEFTNFLNAPPGNQLVIDDNFETDDLIKALSLSGTFWRVDTTGADWADPSFSGMLEPGCAFGDHAYRVYTCMHGFSQGNAANNADNNIAYYFVPYGIVVSADPADPNYVPNLGFRVTALEDHNVGRHIDTGFFETGHANFGMALANCYNNRDYAVASINGRTGDTGAGHLLQDVLVADGPQANIGLGLRSLVQAGDLTLSQLNNHQVGLDAVNNHHAFDPLTERYFTIGLDSDGGLALRNI